MPPSTDSTQQTKPGQSGAVATTGEMARATLAMTPERPVFDLTGWKQIAQHLGMSRRFAYDAAHRIVDALPVHKLGRTAMATSAEINAWVRRQARPISPSESGPVVATTGSVPPLRLVASVG